MDFQNTSRSQSSTSERVGAGFTLVELLVVIGIIALLISILLPALNSARKSALTVVCSSNMHQLGLGYQMYCDQNKGELPQKGPDGTNATNNSFGPTGGVLGIDDPSIWFNAIPPMVGGESYYQMLLDDQAGKNAAPTAGVKSVFICPAMIDPATLDNTDDNLKGAYFYLNGSDSQGMLTGSMFKFDMSYVVNSSMTNVIGNTQTFSRVKMSQLRPGSNVVLMMEKLDNPSEYLLPAVQQFAQLNSAYYGSLIGSGGFISNLAQPKANWKRFSTRHKGGGNLLFADGHVSLFPWRDTQIPASQLPYNPATTDLNQYSKIIWSIVGPIN